MSTDSRIQTRDHAPKAVVRNPKAVQAPSGGVWNYSHLEVPAYLMCPPFSFDTGQPNNIWMMDIPEQGRAVERNKAFRQFQALYQFLSSRAFVQLLPVPGDCGLQDLVFTANIGLVLEHLPARDTVVISNYKSEPRIDETEVGVKFFQSMGYKTIVPTTKFEGEAELKHLHGNVYVGGYGLRSDRETYTQLEEQFGMKVIKVREHDPYLYHLDCTVFPLTDEKTIVCTEMFDRKEISEIERHTEVIDITRKEALPGLCNSVRLGNLILNGSNIHELARGSEAYKLELQKTRKLEDVATENGFEVALFNLSEYQKSGAALSCMVMHLNRASYKHRLL